MAQRHPRPLSHLNSSSTVTTTQHPHLAQETSSSLSHRPASLGNNAVVAAASKETQEVGASQVNRPHKRQKVSSGASSHRFVSQHKWRFSDAQTWLPSRLSAKAQNASGTGSKIKAEPVGSKSPPPTTVQPVLHEVPPEPLTTSKSVPQNGHVDVRTNINEHHVPATHTSDIHPASPNSLPLGYNKQRLSRNSMTLSLEKDADRIAALIAEKRRENESNMFRERMLQKQLQRNARRVSEEYEEESVSPARSGAVHSEASASTGLLLIEMGSARHEATAQTPRSHKAHHTVQTDIAESAGPRKAVPNPSILTQECRRPSEPSAVQTNGALASQQTTNRKHTERSVAGVEREILFGKHSPAGASTRNGVSRSSFLGTSASQSRITSHGAPHGFALYDAHPAGGPATSAATGNNSAPLRHIYGSAGQDGPELERGFPRYSARYTSSSSPQPQSSVVVQRSFSAASAFAPTHLSMSPSSFLSPSSQTSAPLPQAIPSQQYPQRGLAVQNLQNVRIATSVSVEKGPNAAEQAMIIPTMANGTTSQTGASAEQHLDFDRTDYPVSRVSSQNDSRASNVASKMASTNAQQLSPASEPMPTTNMFGGNFVSESSRRADAAAAKPRVNMFGNTRGTPFPMHEVIRQIEMT